MSWKLRLEIEGNDRMSQNTTSLELEAVNSRNCFVVHAAAVQIKQFPTQLSIGVIRTVNTPVLGR